MPKINTTVTLDGKEVDDALIEKARGQIPNPGAGSARIEYRWRLETDSTANRIIDEVVVTFQAAGRNC